MIIELKLLGLALIALEIHVSLRNSNTFNYLSDCGVQSYGGLETLKQLYYVLDCWHQLTPE